MENGHIESFNGRLRDECLNVMQFMSLEDARAKIEAWRVDYNQRRPHSSLGHLTPSEFIRTCQENRARKSAELSIKTVYERDQRQRTGGVWLSRVYVTGELAR